jgi:hypothetical protein
MSDAESMESCQDLRTGGQVLESSRAGADDFFDHEPNHPFALTILSATMFRDMGKECKRDLVAVDERVDLGFVVDSIYLFGDPFIADDDFVEAEMVAVHVEEQKACRLQLGCGNIGMLRLI